MKKFKFDYDSYEGSYQYDALNSKNLVKKFWHKNKLTLIEKKLILKKTYKILDVGCGSGNLCFFLAKKCEKIVGIDISKNAINFAKDMKQKLSIHNCDFIKVSETKDFPFKKDYFDIIFLSEIIEHLDKPSNIIKKSLNVLKKKGVIFLTTPNYKSFWPVLEKFCDFFNLTPKMGGHQHITKFSRKKLSVLMSSLNLTEIESGSFYYISPFLSLSEYLASKVFNFEIKNKIRKGMLLYAICKKN